MTNKKTTVVCIVSLLAGVGLGLFIKRPQPANETVPVKIEKAKKSDPGNLGNEAVIRGLRKRIKELESKLLSSAEKSTEKEKEKKTEVTPNASFNQGFSIANMRKFAEDFKKRDPQGYINMTNRMAQGMARRQEKNLSRLDLLSSFNVSSMTDKQKEVHETYQELLARQTELENILNPQNTDISDEEREKAFSEMRELRRDIHKYAGEERRNLLMQTGIELGVGTENSASFIEIIETVYDVTSPGWNPHGRRGRHNGSMPLRPGWR